MSVSLLLIDPQNDFCIKDGSLYVPGAEEDCNRLSTFIKTNLNSIDELYITLDLHPFYHIAHPLFWVDKNGNHPTPYTSITYESFSNGDFLPANPLLKQSTEEYLLSLENRGRYTLTIWPPHCLIATNGFCVCDSVYNACNDWMLSHPGKNINFIKKSSNALTEHYSAIHAEVPDPADPSTRTNFQLIDSLKNSSKIIIAGEALSHCVANSIRDLSIYINPQKFTLLSDCTSSVSGFESVGKSFIDEFKQKGMNITSSTLFKL